MSFILPWWLRLFMQRCAVCFIVEQFSGTDIREYRDGQVKMDSGYGYHRRWFDEKVQVKAVKALKTWMILTLS